MGKWSYYLDESICIDMISSSLLSNKYSRIKGIKLSLNHGI